MVHTCTTLLSLSTALSRGETLTSSPHPLPRPEENHYRLNQSAATRLHAVRPRLVTIHEVSGVATSAAVADSENLESVESQSSDKEDSDDPDESDGSGGGQLTRAATTIAVSAGATKKRPLALEPPHQLLAHGVHHGSPRLRF
jgi:hypothetical protein